MISEPPLGPDRLLIPHRVVGRTGLRLSPLGLGTSSWGYETEVSEAEQQLRTFIEAGGNLVDLASRASGKQSRAELILGELLSESLPRQELLLSVTSSSPDNCSRITALDNLDRTLLALRTDHVDIWQIGPWDGVTPLAEIAETLEFARTSGRARYVGVRGFDSWQLATVAAQTLLATAQVPYSLLNRTAEQDTLAAARYHGIALLATAPLAGGILTGKYADGIPADSRGANERRAQDVLTLLGPGTTNIVDAVVTAADGLGTSPLSVALAWLLRRSEIGSVIVGTRDNAQLNGVIAAADLILPQPIADALDDVSADVPH